MQQDLIDKNWGRLIRPRRLEAEEGTLSENYGRFACEPLERGFGQTLGNALRRVLLSSLQGAAITTVRINGVLHEFSTIPGVMEDVSDLILNLKEVRLRLHAEGPRTLRVHKKGAGMLTAGDLVSDDQAIEILNPEHKIPTLAPEADVEMELTVDLGKGYVLAERNKTEEMPIGVIPIDSVFSPIRRVNYTVTPARVGRETDRETREILVDIDAVLPGTIDETSGAIAFDKEATSGNFGLVDEIARRALLGGADVLAVRADDIPGGNPLAAILRYTF